MKYAKQLLLAWAGTTRRALDVATDVAGTGNPIGG